MCIITNKDNIVVSVSLIPGVEIEIPENFHVYFPYDGKLRIPARGEYFRDEEWLAKMKKMVDNYRKTQKL